MRSFESIPTTDTAFKGACIPPNKFIPTRILKDDLDIQSMALSALLSNCLGPKSQPLCTTSTHHSKRQHRSAGRCKASGLLLRTKARMQSGAGSAVGNDRIARQMRTNHIRGGLLPRKKGAKSAAAASAGVERRRPFAWRMQMPLPLRGRLVIKRAMHPKGGLRRGREAGLPLYVR